MDFTPALKSDVFRPLVANLVPGGVALTPYALLFGYHFTGVQDLASNYPFAAGVLALFASLAVGLVLENLGLILEAKVWDTLCEKDTGTQSADWWRYLGETMIPEPIGHRYLRQLVTRMKFEATFGMALIVLWVGILWLDVSVPILGQSRNVILVSGGLLALASYLIWESGVTARGLADVRHALLYQAPSRKVFGAESNAIRFDNSFAVMGGILILVGFGLAALLTARVVQQEGWTGLSATLSAFLFGAVLVAAARRKDRDGRRKSMAFRMAIAFGLVAVLFIIRAADRGAYVLGVTSVLIALGLAGFCFQLAWKTDKPKAQVRSAAAQPTAAV